MADPPVAIVGMAAVFPGAADLAAFWRNIATGVDAISEAPASRWDESYYDPAAGSGRASDRFYCRRGGFVQTAAFDPARFGVMPVAVESAEPDQLLALQVAADALADAGGQDRLPDRERVGVIVGRGGYLTPGVARLDQRVRTAHQLTVTLRELLPDLAEERLEQVRLAFTDRLGPERAESSIGLVPNLAASRVANRLDLQGPAYTVDAACASSLVAVDAAVRELASGRCDAVVAGGVHHCHDVTLWSVFNQLGALSPSQRIRPFHRQADGILIGEGTGMVVLKRLVDAEHDGDRVYAVIRGTGVASDGRASSLMKPRADGQALAVRRAWRAAGLDPAEPGAIGLLEAHGTATPAGDETEIASLTRVFGPARAGRPADIGLGSVKSMIGHAMPAAGIAGLIKAALAVHHRLLPPTLHCDEPHPALDGSRFAPLTEARPWPDPDPAAGRAGSRTPRRAGVDAFGFGGINAHVVLEQPPAGAGAGATVYPVRPAAAAAVPGRAGTGAGPAADRQERVLLLAARTPAALGRALRAGDDLLLSRDDSRARPDGGPYRLALVAPTRRRLDLARRIVDQGTPWRGRSDIWFTGAPLLGPHAAEPGSVAFVFPGLEQGFAPRVDDIADHFGWARPDLGRPGSGQPGVGHHGMAVVAVGRLLDAALRELGVAPDLVAGHSVGEWNAMIAAGMYPRDAIEEFIAAFDADALQVPGVVFAALGCGADQAANAIGDLDRVVVSHDNCPHQSIVCGDQAAVATVLERLRGRGVTGQVLPFRSGFHSPMLAPYLDPIRANAARLPLRPPAVPVWSATTVAPYPEAADEVRDLIIRHLVEPVRFRSLVRRLHEHGTRAFVQVGAGSLPGFIADTLHGGHDHLAVTGNAPKRPGLDQLRRVAAALWAEGMAPRFDRLPGAAPAAPAFPGPSSEPTPAPAEPTAAAGVPLDLGAPLVRLGDAAAALRPLLGPAPARTAAPAIPPPPAGADRPVLAEFDAALRDATVAAAEVLRRWEAAPPGRSPLALSRPAPASPTASATAASPTAASPTAPPDRAVTTRTLSLRALPFLADHCLYRQPPGWADESDRYPVVPMTTTLEMMAQAARDLVPGRTVSAIRSVRALRWLAVAPPVDVPIEAVVEPVGNGTGPGSDGRPVRVRVTVGGYARGTVVLGDRYPAASGPPVRPLATTRPCDVTADRLYLDRWMFHGPAFRGVAELGPVGDDGIDGVLAVPDTPGALLDNAGQLMGFWIMKHTLRDRLALPSAVDAVTFHGPHPVPGVRVACAVRIRSVTDLEVVADLELRGPDGRLWCRVDGWRDRRFATDEVTWPVFRNPAERLVAQAQPGGWYLATERWPDSATRELIMRRYLGAAERAEYAGRNPNAQRQWLLGRVAAKDAVRRHLWDRGAGPLFPVQIAVRSDDRGRPLVSGPFAEPVHVSLAHTGPLAAAVAGPGEVGIDIERVADRGPGTEAAVLTDHERALLDRRGGGADPGGAGRATELTRFWCAKEAVAKAEGTGLAGRPKRFVVDRADGDRLLVTVRTGAGDRDDSGDRPGTSRWVATTLVTHSGPNGPETYAVAWTPPGPAGDTLPRPPAAEQHGGHVHAI